MKPLDLAIGTVLRGAGGGGSSAPRTPIESPDSLRSISYARILDLVSEGEIYGFADQANPLSCAYLNETPVANADGSLNFKNIQIDSRVGTQVQDYLPGFDGVENEIGVATELRSDTPWTKTVTNLNLNALRVRLSTPALSKTNTSNGDVTGYTIRYRIELQVDSGTFVSMLESAFTGKTSSKYERTHRIDLPAATTSWTLRVVRVTANANTATIQDTMVVESYAEIIDAKLRMPMSALVSVVVDAEQFNNIPSRAYRIKGRIIKVPANYDPDTRTYSGVWDGTFKPAWSDNPAWVFYDMALNTRYGLGHLIDQSLVDKWSLYRIAQYCDQAVPNGFGGMEPRFTCNLCLQTQNDALRVMQDMATAFRGIIYATGNTVTAVADMPEDSVYTYNQANVIGGKFSYSGSSGKVRHTVALVSWNDPSDFYRAKVEYVESPEGIARYGIQQTEVIAIGCSSRGQARRWGLYLLTTEQLESDACTWSVGLDGTVVAPGKICKVADPLRANARTGGRISSATINSIVTDAAPTTVAAGDKLVVILPSGISEERTILSIVDKTVTVTSNFSDVPVAQSVWAVESDTLALQMFRVLSVAELSSGDAKGYTIGAIQHVPGKFAFIDNNIKIDPPPIAPIPSNVVPSPTGLAVVARDVVEQNTVAKVVNLSWNIVPVANHYKVQWRMSAGSWVAIDKIGTTDTDLVGVGTGDFEVQVIAVDVLGRSSRPTFGGPYNVSVVQTPPGYVNDINDQFVSVTGELTAVGAQADQLRVDVDAATAAVNQEVTDRTTAINDEANARATAILNEQNARIAAVSSEATTRQTADDSLATQISLVSAGSGEQFDSAKIWYFDADLESWTGNGAPTIVDGWLRPANHATDPYVTSPTGLGIAGQSYRFSKVRIKKVGTPAWQGELRWRLAGDAAGVWRGPTAIPEPPFDANGVTAISWDDIAWWPGTIDQIRIDLSTAQSASSYYLIDWIALGRPTPGAGVALVQDETAARVAADSAEATQRSTLATQMRGAYTGTDVAGVTTGLLYSEKQARSAADGAMATDISSLQARMPAGTGKVATEASVTDEASARVTADGALSTRTGAMEARMPSGSGQLATSASVTTEATARATADTAMAADIALLGAHNAGKTAFILDQNKVQIDGTTTFAQMLSGLSAADGALGSRVDTEQAARISGDTANANATLALQATLSADKLVIADPDFETAGLPDWDVGSGTWYPFASTQRSGTRCLRTDANTSNDYIQSVVPTPCAGGEVLRPSAWFRGAGTVPDGYIRFVARTYDASLTQIAFVAIGAFLPTDIVGGDFTKYAADYTTPTNARYIKFGFQTVSRTVGSWLIDDFAVERPRAGELANASAITATNVTVSQQGADIEANANQISTVITTVGQHTASISTLTQSTDGLMAQAALVMDVNGRLSGMKATATATQTDIVFAADKVSIESPGGGARTEYSGGNWRVYDGSGTLRVRMGVW